MLLEKVLGCIYLKPFTRAISVNPHIGWEQNEYYGMVIETETGWWF